MEKISPSEFAKKIGISRQAVSKAIAAGAIPFTLSGTRKTIDLADPDVQAYIQNNSRQREQGKEVSGKTAVSKKPSEKPVKKTAKTKKASEKQKPKKAVSKKPSEKIDLATPMTEINRRDKIASMRKKELTVEYMQKNYFPREFVEDGLFRYIERLNSTLERSASVFVNETGQKILEAGEVTPKHIESFIALVLETIDNTRKAIRREMKRYEPKI